MLALLPRLSCWASLETVLIPYTTAGYGSGPNGLMQSWSTVDGYAGDLAVKDINLAALGLTQPGKVISVSATVNVDQIAGSETTFWNDMAFSLFDVSRSCEISWGGYTPSMRLSNYQVCDHFHIMIGRGALSAVFVPW